MAIRNRPASPKRSWWRMAAMGIMGLLCLVILYQLWLFCWVVYYNFQPPSQTSVMRQELSRLQESNPKATLRYEWVDYENIDDSLKRAVVAAEDANFVDHSGVEWEAIRKAWEYNQNQAELGRARMRGGSTITQQVAKNIFLSGSRTYLRKGQELVLTYMIERVMPKRRILELYLNVAEWGTGVFGAQAAARHYYNVDASRLGAAQAARMAAMLPNPRYYDNHRTTRFLNARTQTYVRRMRDAEIP